MKYAVGVEDISICSEKLIKMYCYIICSDNDKHLAIVSHLYDRLAC